MITATAIAVIFFAAFVYSSWFRTFTYSIYSVLILLLTAALSFRFDFDIYEISKLEFFGLWAFAYLIYREAKKSTAAGDSPWLSVFYDLAWTGRILFFITIGSAIVFTLDKWVFHDRIIETPNRSEFGSITKTLVASYLIIYFILSILSKRVIKNLSDPTVFTDSNKSTRVDPEAEDVIILSEDISSTDESPISNTPKTEVLAKVDTDVTGLKNESEAQVFKAEK